MISSEILDLAEQLIVAGSSERAAKRLLEAGREVDFRDLPVAHRVRWAQLLRRSGQPREAIRRLHPFIRGQLSEIMPPHADEILEYAAALSFYGLEDEATTLLLHMHTRPAMRDLYLAFALFPQWRYREAQAPLENFIKNAGEELEYFKTVAEVNLGSVQVFLGRHREAEELLLKTAAHASRSGYRLLCGNAWELLAQISLQARNFAQTEQRLNESQRHLSGVQSLDALYIAKWQALLRLERTSGDAEIAEQLKNVEAMARERNHYETIRDLALRRVVKLHDSSLAKTLMKGTPYPGFFHRPEGKTAIELAMVFSDEPVHFAQGPLSESSDVSQASPERALPDGGLERQMLQVLFSDFYKPFSIQRLWQATAPGQYFNPGSSPNLVHQKLHLTRKWVREAGAPFKIICRDNRYEIQAERPFALTLPLAGVDKPIDKLILFMQMKPQWTLRELEAITLWPRRSLQRHLNLGVANGALAKTGKARATKYSVV